MEKISLKKISPYLIYSSSLIFLLAGFFLLFPLRSIKNELEIETSEMKERRKTDQILSGLPINSIDTPSFGKMEIIETSFPEKVCNITNYGAIGDGKTKNTEAFAKAIQDCASQGGGKILVPPGNWLTGPIHLKSNLNLHLEKNAHILFSTDFKDYLPAVFSRFEGVEYHNYSPPIYAKNCVNLAITGEGSINGQGEKSWWNLDIFAGISELYRMGADNLPVKNRDFAQEKYGLRPAFVEFVNCNAILLDGITVINGPMWTIHPVYSKNIIIRNLNISTAKGRSTDGIAIDSSQNVLVENSVLSTGDDSIVIKSGRDSDGLRVNKPSKDIVIRDCQIKETHSGLAIGSEVSGGVKNVYASNLTIKNSDYAARIKSSPGRGGNIENIFIENFIDANANQAGLAIDMFYESQGRENQTPLTNLKNVTLKNIRVENAKIPFFLKGYPGEPPIGITLENLVMRSNNDASIENASGISFDNLQFSVKNKKRHPEGLKIKIKNSSEIEIKNSPLQKNQIICENCQYNLVPF